MFGNTESHTLKQRLHTHSKDCSIADIPESLRNQLKHIRKIFFSSKLILNYDCMIMRDKQEEGE